MNSTFDDDLRRRLIDHRGRWRSIAERADVSYSWLSQFAREKIPNPGFGTLTKVAAAIEALAAERKKAA